MTPVHRRIAALSAVVAALIVTAATPTSARADTSLPQSTGSAHILWGATTPTAQSATNNLIYHGGQVETTPAVYLVFWGPEWQSGFTRSAGGVNYNQKSVENYITTFFGAVGGSPYAGIQSQYCQNVDVGFSCAGNPLAQYIANPTHQLKGVWVDPTSPPTSIVTTGLAENVTADPLETEALAASGHFGYDPNATYFILTQPGTQATAYGTVYCAYHSETGHTTGRGVRYAFMPYVMDYASGCGENSVNATNNSFGNGYLDGYSIVAGHEWAEAITDPDNFNGTQDGWNDIQTSENGDKCAWVGMANISLGKRAYAVQPLWSNEANNGDGGCVLSR